MSAGISGNYFTSVEASYLREIPLPVYYVCMGSKLSSSALYHVLAAIARAPPHDIP